MENLNVDLELLNSQIIAVNHSNMTNDEIEGIMSMLCDIESILINNNQVTLKAV